MGGGFCSFGFWENLQGERSRKNPKGREPNASRGSKGRSTALMQAGTCRCGEIRLRGAGRWELSLSRYCSLVTFGEMKLLPSSTWKVGRCQSTGTEARAVALHPSPESRSSLTCAGDACLRCGSVLGHNCLTLPFSPLFLQGTILWMRLFSLCEERQTLQIPRSKYC